MASGKLTPLGDPAPNAPKWFAAMEVNSLLSPLIFKMSLPTGALFSRLLLVGNWFSGLAATGKPKDGSKIGREGVRSDLR
jgi:hypothetical protein